MNRLVHISIFLSILTLASAQTHAQDLLRISRIVMAQQVDSSPPASYPEDAKAAGIEGMVALDVVISPKGIVEQVQILSGPDKLREAAKQAVSKWIYKPYKIDDVAKEVDTTVLIAFSLKDGNTSRNASGDAIQTAVESPTNPAAGAASGTPLSARTGIIQISSGVSAGNKLSGRSPKYPDQAKAAKVSGSVILHVILSKSGTVESLDVVSGPDLLREAAVDAVKTWTYKPFIMNGQPVKVETMVNVNFNFTVSAHPASNPPSGNAGPPPIGSGGFGPH